MFLRLNNPNKGNSSVGRKEKWKEHARIIDNDLTDPHYWSIRQKGLKKLRGEYLWDASWAEWLPIVVPHLQQYEGQRFLELGCSPGLVSALICSRISLNPEGVDFSPEADLYMRNLEAVGVVDARLYHSDLREFTPESPYDVVGSFGLVEHFEDPGEILGHHNRMLRKGGLCIVVIPNFRGFQYAYHYLFDRSDLRQHNKEVMSIEVFRSLARKYKHEVLSLGYSGRLRFWNVDLSGGRIRKIVRRCSSKLVREVSKRVGRILPEGHPWLAPWMVYVGRKTR